jgi:hypothetical protein
MMSSGRRVRDEIASCDVEPLIMDTLPRHGDLEISEDAGFEVKEWRWQRAGRWLVLLVVLTALSGLTGKGLLSRTQSATSDGAQRVEYDRFLRKHDGAVLTISLRRPTASRTSIDISAAYLERMKIERMTPEPEDESLAGDSQRFMFASRVGPGGKSQVVIHFEPMQTGSIEGSLRIDGGAPLSIRHFVYP